MGLHKGSEMFNLLDLARQTGGFVGVPPGFLAQTRNRAVGSGYLKRLPPRFGFGQTKFTITDRGARALSEANDR